MIRVVILFAAISPPLFILGYGIAKARGTWKSEAIWNAFFVGAVSGIAAIGCELALGYLLQPEHMSPLVGAAINAVLLAAIPEEAIKFFVLVSLAEKHVDVRRMQDLVVLALAVSLGFAMPENFFYVISIGDWKATVAMRAITSVPGHGINGLAMGALLVAARTNAAKSIWAMPTALIVPMLLHAAYDFPLFAIGTGTGKIWFGAAWLLVLVLSSVLAIVLSNRMLARARQIDRATGRDAASIETTDRLIAGGSLAVTVGPLVAVGSFYIHGVSAAPVAAILGIVPIALGVDAILTGLKRRRTRTLINATAAV